MREIVKYYDNTLEKDETKIYFLYKKVSTPDTLFLYYKSKKKIKEELNAKVNVLKEELNTAQEAIDFLIQIGGEV